MHEYSALHALEFLIAHELAHIVNGHIAMMMNQGLGFVMSEAVGDKRNTLGNMDRQAFELDADVTAAVIAFKSVMEIQEAAVSEKQQMPHYAATLLKDRSAGIRLFFFAIARLFLLLGPDEPDLDSLEGLDHPPNFMRMTWIAGRLNRIYERDFPGLVETPFLELASEAYLKSEKCLIDGQKGFSSSSQIRHFEDPRFKSHIDRLWAHWQTIAHDVERFKLGGTRQRYPISPQGNR